MEALEGPGYAESSDRRKRAMVWRHAFPRTIDQFVGGSYSRFSTQTDPKTGRVHPVHSILAEIEWFDSGGNKQITRGAFDFSVDAEGICYHRYFRPHIKDAETLAFTRGKHEVDFPALARSHELYLAKAEIEVAAPEVAGVYRVGPLETILIRDESNNFNITLFKLSGIYC
jgi:hypothetical protein